MRSLARPGQPPTVPGASRARREVSTADSRRTEVGGDQLHAELAHRAREPCRIVSVAFPNRDTVQRRHINGHLVRQKLQVHYAEFGTRIARGLEMLESLELRNVGPTSYMVLNLASRKNLITGDNGLGKSFLLDVAWWALTRWWPRDLNPRLTSGYPARPRDMGQPAKLCYTVKTATGQSKPHEFVYSGSNESWSTKIGRPLKPGLVIHAHADGGFSVWDPIRNYWRQKGDINVPERLPAYVFSSGEVWAGLIQPVHGKSTKVCKGLLDDWSGWIRERGENAQRMANVLGILTTQGGAVELGPLQRLSVNDAQDIPFTTTPAISSIFEGRSWVSHKRGAPLTFRSQRETFTFNRRTSIPSIGC